MSTYKRLLRMGK